MSESDNYTVKICDYYDSSVCDESDAYFSIESSPMITITSPNGGEVWSPGSSESITWDEYITAMNNFQSHGVIVRSLSNSI